MQVYEQSMNRMAHVAFFENGEIIYAPTAAVLRRALRTRSRLDPCRVWFRPTDEWKAASDAYLAAWRASHPFMAYGYAFTDAYDAGDCSDASEVYGA